MSRRASIIINGIGPCTSYTHQKNIGQLDWSPDGIYLVTASEDAVCVWDAATLKPLHTQPAQTGKIASCCFVSDPIMNNNNNRSSNGPVPIPSTSRIAFGEYESIYLWRFRDTLTSSAQHSSTASTNGVYMNGGGQASDMKDSRDTPALTLTTVQSGMVNCLAPLITLSEDGSGTLSICLASGSGHRDSNLKLWDVLDHQPVPIASS
ncbi:hypothetical protein BDF19DRAFT_61857 [Syncephalis fuscata]|nr:hypothetical protein BDF19DRAFT_61857 [Syncephalis fuscata]